MRLACPGHRRGSGFTQIDASAGIRNWVRETYLDSPHRTLHDVASTVHCATQDPDSPQFCAQEKLAELQLLMHSAKCRF
jgi:hypothetical protein